MRRFALYRISRGLDGGTIPLGIHKEEALFPLDLGDRRYVSRQLLSDIASACASLFNQPVRIDIRPLVDDAVILKIDVPEPPSSQKPLDFKATGLPKGIPPNWLHRCQMH